MPIMVLGSAVDALCMVCMCPKIVRSRSFAFYLSAWASESRVYGFTVSSSRVSLAFFERTRRHIFNKAHFDRTIYAKETISVKVKHGTHSHTFGVKHRSQAMCWSHACGSCPPAHAPVSLLRYAPEASHRPSWQPSRRR